MSQYYENIIQPERRLHIRATISEMYRVSALLYGGVSLLGLITILLPTWNGLDYEIIVSLCSLGVIFSALFYLIRDTAPLWLAIIHIPLGICMMAAVIYSGHAPQAVGLAIIFVLSSAYLFHYLIKNAAIGFVIFAMILYSIVLNENNIEGWQSIVFFSFGSCLLMGVVVWLSTRRLHLLTVKDSLTGLLNRSTIDAITNSKLELYEDKKVAFAFLVIDLNKFKEVNDTLGHLHGDKILQQFSRKLESITKPKDSLARWGGDEFIVILESEDQVHDFDTQLRKASKDIISFSLGVSYPQQGDDLDSLMHRADECMYEQKHKRRVTD